MFSGNITTVPLIPCLARTSVSTIGILVIGLITVTSIVAGCWLERRKYTRLIAAYQLTEEDRLMRQRVADQQAEAVRKQRLEELFDLRYRVTVFICELCGTDELTEASREQECEVNGEVYQRPEPVDGCQDVFIEVCLLQKVLSQLSYELEERRCGDIDMEFFRRWDQTLHARYNQWLQRKEAIADLVQLQQRLAVLQQVLCRFHGTHAVSLATGTLEAHTATLNIESYQDIYQAACAGRELIALQIQRLEETEGICPTPADSVDMVEKLEAYHQKFDGYEDVFDLFTKETIKAEARERWRDVVLSTPESRTALLQEFLAESIGKYLQGFTQARRSLSECGPCGQKKAVESFRAALVHWSCSQALLLVLREQLDCVEDLTDPLTVEYYTHEFDLAVLWRCEQDLRVLERSMHAFHADFERSCANFLL